MPSRVDLKEVSGYYQALGKFVDTFANVEEILFLYLRVGWSSLRHGKSHFSGVRIHDAVSFIKRIAEVGKAELSAALDDVLSQLLIINDVRNLILHHPVRLVPLSQVDQHLGLAGRARSGLGSTFGRS
jgi:hypothetical protein